jgi:hypothetical protein
MNEARARLAMSDSEIVGRFERFGYKVSITHIAFTTETVDDFRQARKNWNLVGRMRTDEPGLLIIEKAQPRAGQPARDIVVVGLGGSRAVMGVHVAAGAPPLASGSALCRYAPTMHWAPAGSAALTRAIAGKR